MSDDQTYRPRNDQMTIAFTGRCAEPSEKDYSDSGATPRLRLRVANASTKGKGDNLSEVTAWIPVVLFGNQAKGLYEKVALKGVQVAVKGRLVSGQTQRVKTVGNGEREFNSTSLEVIADTVGGITLLGGGNGSKPAPAAAAPAADGEDLPF